MTIHHFISTSISNRKVVSVKPGTNDGPFKIGLFPYMLQFEEWVAATVASTWNNSGEASLTAIKAVANDDTSVSFTHLTAGEDFEITVINGDGQIGAASAIQSLTFNPIPGGGTFTVSDGVNVSGNITWSAVTATLVTRIQNAINAMTGYSVGDVVVSHDGTYLLDFSSGKFAGQEVDTWVVDGTNLTGGDALAVISSVQDGNAGTDEHSTIHFPAAGTHTASLNEIQQIDTINGVDTGTFKLTVPSHGTTKPIAYNAGRTFVKSALENVVGIGNVKVTGGPLAEPTDVTDTQTIALLNGVAGGTFTLTFSGQTTGNIAYNASAATVQTALEALSNIAPGDVTVTGASPSWQAQFATVGQPLMTVDGALLTGGTNDIIVTPVQDGTAGANEVQTLSIVGTPDGGTFTLSFNGQVTAGIAFNASAATVQTALRALTTINGANVNCTGGALPGTPIVVTFVGTLANNDVPLIVGNGAGLTTTGSISYANTTTQAAVAGQNKKFRIQTNRTNPAYLAGDRQFKLLLHWGVQTNNVNTEFTGVFSLNTGTTLADIKTRIEEWRSTIDAEGGHVTETHDGLVGAGNTDVTGTLDDFTIEFKLAQGCRDISLSMYYYLQDGVSSPAPTYVTISSPQNYLPGTNEKQKLQLSGAAPTQFYFNFDGISAGPFTSGAGFNFAAMVAAINLAMRAYSTAGDTIAVKLAGNTANFAASTDNFILEFVGEGTQAKDVAAITLTAAPASGFTVDVAQTTQGSSGTSEIQSVDFDDNGYAIYSGTFTLTADGQTTAAIAYNASAVVVQAALDLLSNITGLVSVVGLPGQYQVSFDPSLANLALIVGASSMNNVGSSVSFIDHVYRPILVEFINALGLTNIGQMTTDGVALVTTVQGGGSQTVNNIAGGTFALVIQGHFTVPNIPIDVSAATLQTMIEVYGGAGCCTVGGGPAPADLTLAFTGALGNANLNVSVISSIVGNFGSSVLVEQVRRAVPLPVIENVWDMTVIPGQDTLSVDTTGWVQIKIIEPSPDSPVDVVDTVINVRLLNIDAKKIEDAVNEAFGMDVCRVTRVVHSEEHDIIEGAIAYNGDNNAPLHFWYYKDVFRFVFFGPYQAADSITSINVQINNPSPANWLHQADTDDVDEYPEALRVYLGFFTSFTQGVPVQEFSIVRNTDLIPNQLSYRMKLEAKSPLPGNTSGQDTSDRARRVGVARELLDTKLVFKWSKDVFSNESDEVDGVPEQVLAAVAVNWDASPEQIQAALETLISGLGFIGAGNVRVFGSLFNSWLSESTVDNADELYAYNDLHIVLTGKLEGLPLNDIGYSLQCELTNSPIGLDLQQQRRYRSRIEEFTKPTPVGVNQRQRITLSSPEFVTNMSLSIDGGTPIPFTPETTAAQLQALLATALGQFLVPDLVIDTLLGADICPVPASYRLPALVYGTTFADVIEIEWTGYGYQYSANDLAVGVSNPSDVVTIVTTQQGSAPVQEIQALVLTHTPTSGTYTVDGSGNIAYNADAAAIQTAIGVAPPTVTGAFPSFLLTWPTASGNVALLATTNALNNVADAGVFDSVRHGGAEADFLFTEVTKGLGPKYADVAANYDTGLVPQCGDTVIIDDNVKPFAFGVDWTAKFIVTNLTASQFTYIRKRVVFPDNLKVQLFVLDGTAPTGMVDGNFYRVVQGDTHGKFNLVEADTLDDVVITDKGTGTYELRVTEIVFLQYSRGTPQIGLPNRRSGSSLEHLSRFFRAGFTSVELGIESGDGLSLARIDTLDLPTPTVVHKTNAPDSTVVSAVEFLFDNTNSTLNVEQGNVGVAVYSGESSTLKSLLMQAGATVTLQGVTVTDTVVSNGGVIRILSGVIASNVTIQ